MVKVIGKTKIDFRNFNKKIIKTQKAIQKSGEVTIFDLGNIGKAKAKSIAPFWSGKTAKAIRTINRQGPKPTSSILTPNMYPHPMSDGQTFNLPRWLHTSPEASRRSKKSGDYQYMYTTARWLRSVKKEVAKGHFNKINIK